MVIYSKAKDDADGELDFLLRRSIDLIEREKAMAKKNGKKKSERASVSRERRIALALRGVLDEAAVNAEPLGDELLNAINAAHDELDALGYGSLISIRKRLKELNEQLKAAVDAGDGKEISRLGLEIERAKAGKEPVKVEPKADAASA